MVCSGAMQYTTLGSTAPIIGARNLEQLEPSLAAADFLMGEQQRKEISDLTPPVPVATDRDEERA